MNVIGLDNEIKQPELTIRIPKLLLENDAMAESSTIKFMMNELSACLLDYKQNFNVEPNEMKFCGKNGKKLYDIFKDMFSSVYTCTLKEYGQDCVILSSNNNKEVNQKQQKGVKSMSSFDGVMIEGFHAPSMSEYLSFSYDMEKKVETKKQYNIVIY